MTNRVVVVGSINADIIASVPERPTPGKTVLASRIARRSGGKGANQAAAAARAGADTVLIAAVGDDAEAAVQLAELAYDGVDVSKIITISGATTGLAFITVTADGENAITVAPGANGSLTVPATLATLDAADPSMVVLQTEVSPEVIEAVAAWCRQNDVRLVLNDGPYVPLSAATLAAAHPLVVNEHEAREICAARANLTTDDLAVAVAEVTGARSVVVTLGERGSHVVEGASVYVVHAVPASLVTDTTGAGDTFLGTLAASLASGEPLPASVRRASAAAAVSVAWTGARPPRG